VTARGQPHGAKSADDGGGVRTDHRAGSNAINNLPAGLIASATAIQAHSPESVIDALLIGVDLGPNLSITGSFATILWLASIRRDGEEVSFTQFFKIGAVVMLPALVLSMVARLLIGH
jgi:arsenical pump membrane protein